jgi:hypothetical protein
MKKILIAICCATLLSTAATAQFVTGADEGLKTATPSPGTKMKKAKSSGKTSKGRAAAASKEN